ncbi:YqaA family protein [Magnetococcus marinus]|nr:YqaA family protein [Magnetococcus marinus]
MHWAMHPKAVVALFLVAVAESSFFPIPPDLLLMAMALAEPMRSLLYAAVCTAGSVLGGALGYLIGYLAWDWIGAPILTFYGKMEAYDQLAGLFDAHGAWVVAIAGFSPLPYKLFTITAGALHANFALFMVMSLLSRGARFFLVAALLRWGGEPLRKLVERHLDLLTVAVVVVIVAIVVVMKWIV